MLAVLLFYMISIADGVCVGIIVGALLKKMFDKPLGARGGSAMGIAAGIAAGIAYSVLCIYLTMNDVVGVGVGLIIFFAPIALLIILNLIL